MYYIRTNIKILREERRLSIDEFAEMMGVESETVKLWEKGKLEPTSDEIKKMCPILRIHEEDFLERDILAERKGAGANMKKGDSRKTYDWYYGNRLVMSFYVSYLILIPILCVITYILTGSIIKELFKGIDLEPNFILTYQILYTLIVEGFVSGIYVVSYVFKKGIIRFQVWYLWIITPLIVLTTLLCGIAMPVLYGYAFYKGLILKGKNR